MAKNWYFYQVSEEALQIEEKRIKSQKKERYTI